MRIIAIIIAVLSLLAGCKKVEPTLSEAGALAVGPTGRVTVTQVGTFRDVLAYSGWRGVYLVKDNETGQEFIGVSGVGISETGRHATANRSHTTDER